jgi:hypothetical protein
VETRLFLLIDDGGSRLSARAFNVAIIVDTAGAIFRERMPFQTYLALALSIILAIRAPDARTLSR